MLFTNKDIRKLIIPLIIEQFLTVLVGMADTIMVSQVGEAAISAVSLVDTVNVLLINVFAALANGGAVVAGQFLGHKNRSESCKVANQLLIFAAICSTVVMTIIIAFHNVVLHGAFGEVSEDVMSAANDVKFCMVVSIISMWAVRIAPSYILAGNLGFGVKGVFLAEPISKVVGGIACYATMRMTIYRKLGEGENGN